MRRVTKNKPKDQASSCIIHFYKNKSEKKLRQLTATCFKKIKDTVDLRQKKGQPNEKLNEICSQVPEQYSQLHGVHPWCYKTLYITNTEEEKNVTQVIPKDRVHLKQEECQNKQYFFQRIDVYFVTEIGCGGLAKKNEWPCVKQKQQKMQLRKLQQTNKIRNG